MYVDIIPYLCRRKFQLTRQRKTNSTKRNKLGSKKLTWKCKTVFACKTNFKVTFGIIETNFNSKNIFVNEPKLKEGDISGYHVHRYDGLYATNCSSGDSGLYAYCSCKNR